MTKILIAWEIFVLVGQFRRLGAGRPISIARMKGRSRAYTVNARNPPGKKVISVVFNERCDMIAATAVLGHDRSAAVEPGVIEFLNGNTVMRWAEITLGLESECASEPSALFSRRFAFWGHHAPCLQLARLALPRCPLLRPYRRFIIGLPPRPEPLCCLNPLVPGWDNRRKVTGERERDNSVRVLRLSNGGATCSWPPLCVLLPDPPGSMPIRVFSRSDHVAGLVTLRQTFVRRRHRRTISTSCCCSTARPAASATSAERWPWRRGAMGQVSHQTPAGPREWSYWATAVLELLPGPGRSRSER